MKEIIKALETINYWYNKPDFNIGYVRQNYLLTSKQTENREFRALESINDNYPKYLISMDDITINHPQGIIHKNVWDFVETLKKY
ncbi:MAG: hypothetical protein K8R58_05910 [Bacteroidales bacterium]|nr:hypothetical protein [Bacteroidales bacterium]